MTPETPAPARPGTVPSRTQALALAAVLAATALTAGIAVAGLAHKPGAPPASIPTVDRIITPAPAAPSRPQRVEPGD